MIRWKSWNDQLSLLLIVGIPGLWLAHHWVPMPPEVIGSTITAWSLVIFFYFRKKPNNGGDSQGG